MNNWTFGNGRNLAINYALFACSILFTLVAVEASVRVFHALRPHPCSGYRRDPLNQSQAYSYGNAAYPPNLDVRHCEKDFDVHYQTDKRGFRGLQPPDVHPTMLTVGDSFGFGYGVGNNDTFSAYLGSYNAGLWGTSFDYHIRALENLLPALNPKIVLWDLYPSHIVTLMEGGYSDNCPGSKTYLKGDGFGMRLARALIKFPLIALRRYSAAFDLIKTRFNKNQIAVRQHELLLGANCYFTKEAVLYDENLGMTNYGSTVPGLDFNLKAQRDSAYEKTRDFLRRGKRAVDKQGAKLYFVLLPSKTQLKMIMAPHLPGKNPLLPMIALRAAVKEAGFEEDTVIDLTDRFLQADAEKLFFSNDAHWTPEGHKAVAEYLKEAIAKKTAR